MAIQVEINEIVITNVAAGVPVFGNNMPLFAIDDLDVYYGSSRALAVYPTDYSITLAVDFQTFTFTPTASLITKIGLLGAGNVVYLKRTLDYKSDLTEGDAFFRQKLVQTVDKTLMRLQQINNRMRTGVDHNITISTSAPSGGVDGDLWFKV